MTNLSSFSSSSKPAYQAILVKIAEFFAPRAAAGETVFSLPDFVKNSGAINSQNDFDAMLRAIDMAAFDMMYQGIDARNGDKITLSYDFFRIRIQGFKLDSTKELSATDIEQIHAKIEEKKKRIAWGKAQKSPKRLNADDVLARAVGGVYQDGERRHYPEQRYQGNCSVKSRAETRRPRTRPKNNPALIVTKGVLGKGNNLRTGNRCGHEKDKPLEFKPFNKKGNLPAPCFNAIKKLTKAYGDIKKYMPLLNSAGYYTKTYAGKKGRKVSENKKQSLRKVKKSGSHVQMRSERREAIFIVLCVMLSALDMKTMRVGTPQQDGSFRGMTMETIAQRGGISLSRAERAMADLTRIGYVKVFQRHEKVKELYKGLPAVRTISIRLFGSLGLDEMLEATRKGVSKLATRMSMFLEDLTKFALQEQADFINERKYEDKGLPLYELRKVREMLAS